MNQLDLELTENEQVVLEFRIYQHSGAQIAVNQFTEDRDIQMSDDHIARITNNFVEKQQLLSECVIGLVHAHGHEHLTLQDISYNYCTGHLMVQVLE